MLDVNHSLDQTYQNQKAYIIIPKQRRTHI